MAHARQQIRDAIVAALTGLTTTGSNVFPSRSYDVPKENLPCILIYTAAEEMADEASSLGDRRGMILAFRVEARVRPVATDADDQLDAICAEVQAALFAEPTLGGLVRHLDLQSTEIEFDAEAEAPTAAGVMTFGCLYRIDRTDAETIIT